MGALFGKSFVAGDINGIAYTAARCADFLRLVPQAGSCEAAATAHHFDEVVFYRLGAGGLGLLGLAAVLILRRRYPRLSGVRLLPPVVVPTVGAVLFGIAGAGLLSLSLGKLTVGGTTGAGSYLSAALVSLPIFAWYGTRFVRSLQAA
jgi:hypothetical protein